MEDEEIEEMINDHLSGLLNRAIDKLYDYGNPDINFYDKDDELETFNTPLVVQEVSLLSQIMYLSYIEEERNKLKAFGITFRSSELNVFSPANDRKTFLGMLEKIQFETINAITNYYSRDRLTWQIKSIYGGAQ
jgi:hypothetical protein